MSSPPPPPDEEAARPPPPPCPDFNDEEGQALWRIVEVVNEELLECDPEALIGHSDVKEIQVCCLISIPWVLTFGFPAF